LELVGAIGIELGLTDAALEKFVQSPNMSILLTARILFMIQDSGASQMEAFCALDAVKALLPSAGISHVPLSDESSLGSL
jgi:hypothetical protein